MICTYVSEIPERLSNLKANCANCMSQANQKKKKMGLEVLSHDQDGEKIKKTKRDDRS